ncbi:hypothetical protein ACWD0G_19815 [Streptomyces goshikiensis]
MAKAASSGNSHVLQRSTGRRLLFDSKGLRPLLAGDRVAVRDLRADRAEHITPFAAGIVVGSPIKRCSQRHRTGPVLRQPLTPQPWSRTPSAFRRPDFSLGATTPPAGT